MFKTSGGWLEAGWGSWNLRHVLSHQSRGWCSSDRALPDHVRLAIEVHMAQSTFDSASVQLTKFLLPFGKSPNLSKTGHFQVFWPPKSLFQSLKCHFYLILAKLAPLFQIKKKLLSRRIFFPVEDLHFFRSNQTWPLKESNPWMSSARIKQEDKSCKWLLSFLIHCAAAKDWTTLNIAFLPFIH